jgi:CMP-N-acetylneuraminic acid synthetase
MVHESKEMKSLTRDRPEMNLLAIIPARGGSKGIPRKNLAPVAGRPLLAWTCRAALESRSLTRVILSTEDSEIADRGREFGVEVPFLRPPELAQDETPTLPVIRHALEFLAEREGCRPDAIVLLQPTAPLRRAEHIDGAVARMGETGADAVVSVSPVPAHFHPYWVFDLDGDGRLKPAHPGGGPERYPRRQALPPAYTRNGAVYIARTRLILQENSLYGPAPAAYVMPPEDSVNVDAPEDLARAEETLLQRMASERERKFRAPPQQGDESPCLPRKSTLKGAQP